MVQHMGYGTHKIKARNFWAYLFFILMLAFTTFEFFFRENLLSFGLIGFVLIYYLFNCKLYITKEIFFVLCTFILGYFFQYVFISSQIITLFIGRCLLLFGAFLIASIIERQFVSIFVNTIIVISIISLIFYFLSYIPSVKSYLIDEIAPKFVSLNVEKAIQKGGGVNILIYNYQADYISKTIGYARNCGTFWEPGMFAVFLNIALFLHNFIGKPNVFCNLILIVSLITTFSTGGYAVALFIFLVYILQFKQNVFFLVLEVLVFIWVFIELQELEYIGEKIQNQLDSAQAGMGSDLSRFGAMLTQLEMIKASPFLGGEEISKYLTNSRSKTLASGLLYPMVELGVPLALVYYYYLCKSCVCISKSYNSSILIGLFLFVVIMFLSISQTILSSLWMYVFLFVGLLRLQRLKYKKNGKI